MADLGLHLEWLSSNHTSLSLISGMSLDLLPTYTSHHGGYLSLQFLFKYNYFGVADWGWVGKNIVVCFTLTVRTTIHNYIVADSIAGDAHLTWQRTTVLAAHLTRWTISDAGSHTRCTDKARLTRYIGALWEGANALTSSGTPKQWKRVPRDCKNIVFWIVQCVSLSDGKKMSSQLF